MKSAVLVVAGVVAISGAAYAQEPPPVQAPPSATQPVAPPAAVPPATVPQPAGAQPTPESRRDELRVMETMLIQAVQKGAQDLARQLKVSEPGSAFVTGTGRARGFALDGYGLFFDVDVPEMRQSVVWSMQMLELQQQRASVEQFLRNSAPDDPRRPIALDQLRRVDRMIASAQGTMSAPSPTQNTQMAPPDPGMVGAANVAETTTPSLSPVVSAPPPAAPPPARAVAPAVESRSPDAMYTNAVKNALIDAMLRFNYAVRLADDEWLTVAASDSTGPQVPGGFDDSSRIVIRIKGADLAAYRAGRLTLEEVRKRVEVREF